MKTKHGRIVTKAKHAQGKKAYAYISAWTEALQKARKELGIKGFCCCPEGLVHFFMLDFVAGVAGKAGDLKQICKNAAS
eukprot:s2995_g2.t1